MAIANSLHINLFQCPIFQVSNFQMFWLKLTGSSECINLSSSLSVESFHTCYIHNECCYWLENFKHGRRKREITPSNQHPASLRYDSKCHKWNAASLFLQKQLYYSPPTKDYSPKCQFKNNFHYVLKCIYLKTVKVQQHLVLLTITGFLLLALSVF